MLADTQSSIMLKAIILIGGPQKGTRFRPLSLDIPKPLFPVAGLPLIQHHIKACAAVDNMKEVLIIGSYPPAQIQPFANEKQNLYNVTVKYLQEYTPLGTAGGLYHFRDQIRCGSPKAFFVLNGDVCMDFPLSELLKFHNEKKGALVTVISTEATKQQSVNYGCLVTDKNTNEVTHYVEKPSSYVSTTINCGVYVFSLEIFQMIGEIFLTKQNEVYKSGGGIQGKDVGHIKLEQEVLAQLAGSGKFFTTEISGWWCQLKTAGSAIYANRRYLELLRTKNAKRLKTTNDVCTIYSDVYIAPNVKIHPTAVIGPNVSISSGVSIGYGVRIRDSIVLTDAIIEDHSLILNSIIGRGCRIGKWARVEGTPSDPDPNKPFTKMENPPLFNSDGRLNPSITILGCSVSVYPETILLNSIILPNKELTRSIKNEIIL